MARDGGARRQQALGRRIALRSDAKRRLNIEALQEENTEADNYQVDEAEVALLRERIKRVPFLDDIDLRFRNRVMVPKPMSQAVMFCLMDV